MSPKVSYLLVFASSLLLSLFARNLSENNDFILQDGSIGIGTKEPFTQFHIQRPQGHPNGSTIQLQYGDVFSQYTQTQSGGAWNLRQGDGTLQAVFRSYGDSFFNKTVGKVGIGEEFPGSKLEVAGGNIHISDDDSGLILTSANGTCYKLSVSDAGNLITSPITCP